MSEPDVASTIAVDPVPIDNVWPTCRVVGVVKMDIEAGEPAALRRMVTTLKAGPGLRLFIEVEPPALHAANESPEQFLRLLRSWFKRILVIDERPPRAHPLGEAALTSTQGLYCSGVESP